MRRNCDHLWTRVCIVVLSCCLAACEPQDRRPGTWLSGETVDTAVDDWTFTDDYMEVFVQTQPWYGIPFSVTTVVGQADGEKIYVPSIYPEPAEFPGSKYWNRVIASNPDVVMKIGEKLYPRRARLVTEPAEFEIAFEALARKYDFWRNAKQNPDKRPAFVLIRMDDAEGP